MKTWWKKIKRGWWIAHEITCPGVSLDAGS